MKAIDANESTLLVLSGGLDSFVLAYDLAKSGRKFRGLYVDFGKSVSRKEISVVKALSVNLHFPLEIVDVSGLTRMQLGHISDECVDRDEADIKDADASRGEGTYVSGFQILLGVASYYAQITSNSSMTLGVIKEQFDKYPVLGDIFSGFEEITSLLNPNLDRFSILLPFSKVSKPEVVRIGESLEAPLCRAWSCLLGGDVQCGECAQCKSRKAAFRSAKVKDHTKYRGK